MFVAALSYIAFAGQHRLPHSGYIGAANIVAGVDFNVRDDSLPRVGGLLKALLFECLILFHLFVHGFSLVELATPLGHPLCQLVFSVRAALLLQ